MPFKAGDRVKYLNEKGGGIVIKMLDQNHAEILGDDGFEYVVKNTDLVSEGKSVLDIREIKERLKSISEPGLSGIKPKEINNTSGKSMTSYLVESRKNWTSRQKDFVEIDLHIEELVEKPGFLNDGQKLVLQLEHARFCLDEAIKMNIRSIIFIHGVGSGVLRFELRSWLQTMPFLEISNADFRRYGMGATQVIVRCQRDKHAG